MTDEAEIDPLLVAVHVEEDSYDHLNGPRTGEVTIEMTQDEELVLALHFPNDGKVDREAVGELLALAMQSYPQILDQMEAQQ